MKKVDTYCEEQERKLTLQSNKTTRHSIGRTEISDELSAIVPGALCDIATPTNFQMSSIEETSVKSDILRTLTESFASEDLKSLLSPYQFEDGSKSNKQQSSISMDGFQASQKTENHKLTLMRPLTEGERIAERNRKGRERSLRTRRRNASKLKNLEFNCSYLSMENSLLETLIQVIRANTSSEEVVNLTREILSLQSSKTRARDKYVIEEGKASRSLKQGGTLVEKLVVEPALKRAAQKEESFAISELSNLGGWEPSSTRVDKNEDTEENLVSPTAALSNGGSVVSDGGLSDDMKRSEENEKQNTKDVEALGAVPAELLTFLSKDDRQGFDYPLHDNTRSLPSLDTTDLADLLDLDE